MCKSRVDTERERIWKLEGESEEITQDTEKRDKEMGNMRC